MIALCCPCGAVRLTVRSRPAFLHECNCSLCRTAAAHWGYFHPDDVTVTGATTSWQRDDRPEPGVAVHACAACATTTYFRLTPAAIARHGDVQMGVNMRLAAAADLAGIELRFPDGANWPGTGSFDYVRPAQMLG